MTVSGKRNRRSHSKSINVILNHTKASVCNNEITLNQANVTKKKIIQRQES